MFITFYSYETDNYVLQPDYAVHKELKDAENVLTKKLSRPDVCCAGIANIITSTEAHWQPKPVRKLPRPSADWTPDQWADFIRQSLTTANLDTQESTLLEEHLQRLDDNNEEHEDLNRIIEEQQDQYEDTKAELKEALQQLIDTKAELEDTETVLGDTKAELQTMRDMHGDLVKETDFTYARIQELVE